MLDNLKMYYKYHYSRKTEVFTINNKNQNRIEIYLTECMKDIFEPREG